MQSRCMKCRPVGRQELSGGAQLHGCSHDARSADLLGDRNCLVGSSCTDAVMAQETQADALGNRNYIKNNKNCVVINLEANYTDLSVAATCEVSPNFCG
jgi:hypothetical protein